MIPWNSQGRKYLVLKIANLLASVFWIAYFYDGFNPTTTSVEIVKDVEDFQLHSFGGIDHGSSLKKITTDARDFTTYYEDDPFLITDTIELKVTSIFGLVMEYRQYSPNNPQKWIYHKLSSHHMQVSIATSIILFLATVYAVFFDVKMWKFKRLSLVTIVGTFIYFLSLVT